MRSFQTLLPSALVKDLDICGISLENYASEGTFTATGELCLEDFELEFH